MRQTGATIPELIRRASLRFGDAVAVKDDNLTLSFSDVERRSNQLANALLALNPQTGSRVALLLPNRAEFVEADFAIAKAGKVKLPINPRLVNREREWLLENSGADILIYDRQYDDFIEQARGRLDSVKHFVAMGSGGDYEALLAKASDRFPNIIQADDAPSFLLYTSGTTGRPKGATSTQAGRRAATLTMLAEEIDADEGDAMVHVGAVAHGSGSKIIAYYLRGARNILVPKWDPEQFLALLERERATGSFMVPTMMTALVEAAQGSRYDWRSLKAVSYGGAPIAPARLKEACEIFGNVWVQVYGSCEAPHPLTVLPRADHRGGDFDDARFSSVGRATVSTQIRLVNDAGVDVAAGEAGEMWVRGGHVMSGYWDNPDATAAAFDGEWYKTGDIARMDERGYYTIVDRAKDMIISGGLNIYPAEVEAWLCEHPQVLEAAVIGIPDSRWGESVKAIVRLRKDAVVKEQELIDHCKRGLAGYKKPHSVEFIDELPKGSTGKVLKRQLRDAYWKGETRNV